MNDIPLNMFTIGKIPGYNNSISNCINCLDYTTPLLDSFTIIDLFPATLKINMDIKSMFSSGVSKESLGNAFQTLLKDATEGTPMLYFDKILESHLDLLDTYKIGTYDGIRLLATVDSAINNSISHSYKMNPIESGVGGVTEALKKFTSEKIPGVKKAIDNISALASNATLLDGSQYDANSGLNIASKIASGQKTHLPMIWDTSSSNDVLQLSIKLSSPSGDPKAIKRYIIEPIVILFIMSSPLSLSGIDLGTPFLYRVDAKGLGKYKVAGITNVSFDRGGADTVYNIYQQPLTVNVRITVEPLAKDVATMMDKEGVAVYDKAWYQTPKTMFDSLSEYSEHADEIKQFYDKFL